MPNVDFIQFLRQYGMRLLPVQLDDFVPGIAAEKVKKGYATYDTLSNAFQQPAIDWDTKVQEANIVTGNIVRTLSLKGKGSLHEFGVDIEGGLSRSSSVTFSITGVKAMGLKKKTRADIETAIETIKKNKATYKKYKDKLAIDKTFYATIFTATFETQTGVNLRAEIEQNIRLSAGTTIDWKSNKSFNISNNDKVPFGFTFVKF
ncbi:MAG: hypothetical protein SGJ02_00310 [bacterium]|nr:hypothetical protein [bacterium]